MSRPRIAAPRRFRKPSRRAGEAASAASGQRPPAEAGRRRAVAGTGEKWRLKCLYSTGIHVETGDKTFRSFGSYRDTCVSVNGVWLIQEKLIDPWKSEVLR